MKQRLFRVILITTTLLAAAVFLRPLKVFAASGKVSFKADKEEVEVNEIFTVYLCLEADTQIGEFGCYIYYDEEKLSFYRADYSVQGGDGVLKVSVHSTETAGESKQIMIKFVAKQAGNLRFSCSDPKMYDPTGAQISLLSEDLTVSVKTTENLSDDSRLKSLRISPGTLEPAFSPDITEYTTRVSSATGSIYIGALAHDENAKVGIYGHETIYPGENTVRILVTAENGSIREYTVFVYRESENEVTNAPTDIPATPTLPPQPTESAYEWKIDTFEEDGSFFLAGSFRFEIIQDPVGYNIPQGYTKTRLVIGGRSVTVFAPDASESSEFVLLVLRKEGRDAAVYRYDRAEGTIQRFVQQDVTVKREEETVNNELVAQINSLKKDMTTQGLVMALILGGWVVTLLFFAFFVKKQRGGD